MFGERGQQQGLQGTWRGGKYIGVRHIGKKRWEYHCGRGGVKVGRRGMESVGKQPSSVTAHRAAAATVIANIDVFSTAPFQTHSLIFIFFFTLYNDKSFSHHAKKSLAEKRCITYIEIS